MIAVDTNVLIHAHRPESDLHSRSATAIRSLAEGNATWALPWPCLHEFLGVVTHPRVFDPPTPLDIALDQVEAWLESPSVVNLAEDPRHWQWVRSLLAESAVVGPRIHDARVAAVCMAAGVRTLWSFDRDFSRWPTLRTEPPPAV